MGKRALSSHMAGKKHIAAVSCTEKSVSLKSFLNTVTKPDSQCVSPSTETATPCSSHSIVQVELKPSASLSTFVLKDDVTKAEIIWCMHAVMQNHSLRGSESSVTLFPLMFPDSEIALKLKLHKTKISYTILYGLAPYFHGELLEMCSQCEHFVAGFDESLNKICQKGQMDVMIRFWSDKDNEVCTRYYGSVFLGHATAADLLDGFLKALSGLDVKKLMQVSMDGPNVNKKFLQDLKLYLKGDPSMPIILNLGTCGLHTLHNSYKAAIKKTSWGIVEFLRALHYLFRHVPARRADYVRFSGSSIFPLKYCEVRWLENVKVIERTLSVLTHVQKYVEGVKLHKTAPTCKSFKVISTALEDKLLKAKLCFFQSLATDLEPFLLRFQSDLPLAPFVYGSLLSTMKTVMSRFVKPEIIESTTNVATLDLQLKVNILPANKIDLGYATKLALRNCQGVNEREVMEFRQDCCNAMSVLCQKLLEQSPLKYKLTKGISCFDPAVAKQPTIRNARLSTTLNTFVEHNWISGIQADTIQKEFRTVCESDVFTSAVQSLRTVDRVDHFWMKNILPSFTDVRELPKFLKMIFIISHGNAALERGFSINKELLVENLHEQSLVGLRQVHDGVTARGGIHNVVVTKKLIHSARNAHTRYVEAQEKQRTTAEADLLAKNEKKRTAIMIKELNEKKKRILDTAEETAAAIESKIKSLQN